MTDTDQSKIAVITGGSGTIGSGIVVAFLQAGCRVVAPCRSEEAVQSLRKVVDHEYDHQLLVSLSDVSNDYACADLAETVKEKYGAVSYVVSCVGSIPAPGGAPA